MKLLNVGPAPTPETEFSQLLALHNFALMLNSCHKIEEMIRLGGETICSIMGRVGCRILISRPIRGELKLETVFHRGAKPFPAGVDNQGGIGLETFEKGEPIVVADAEQDGRANKRLQRYLGHRAMVSAPISFKGRTMGVIVIYSQKTNQFTDSDGQFLKMLGNHLALAIQNANMVNELEKAATTDPLTDTYNCRYFSHYLSNIMRRQKDLDMSLIMVDIDKFKLINDKYGHLAGDLVLKQVADIMKASIRNGDSVARYGGDEFFIILPDADYCEAMEVAKRIEESVGSHIFDYNNHQFNCSVSWGIASTHGQEGKALVELIRQADNNLYKMKHEGESLAPSKLYINIM
ncbi:MAG TPA: sensor domain-containing diguanylate cyclase [Bacillota bacterium]|nr:sensor domain-containing diguanylate cyclase [Bacillota bacterium]